MRAGHGGNLGVNVGGRNAKVSRLSNQVTDLRQERLVLVHIDRLAFALGVPGINLSLEFVTLDQQRLITRCQVVDYGVAMGPESSCIDTGTRDSLVVDEIVQDLCDLKAADLNTFCHRSLPRILSFSCL